VFIVRCQRIGDPALEVTFVAAGLRRGNLSAVLAYLCSREVSQRPTTPFSHISLQMRAVGHEMVMSDCAYPDVVSGQLSAL
jgi:hypothetical protein